MAPDVEALVIGYLNAALIPPVSSQVPNPRPAAFVRVSLSGGPGFTDGMYEALLTVEAWSATKPAASDLARRACAHLEAAPGFYATATAPRWFPDESNQPRYVATAQVWTRGTPI